MTTSQILTALVDEREKIKRERFIDQRVSRDTTFMDGQLDGLGLAVGLILQMEREEEILKNANELPGAMDLDYVKTLPT